MSTIEEIRARGILGEIKKSRALEILGEPAGIRLVTAKGACSCLPWVAVLLDPEVEAVNGITTSAQVALRVAQSLANAIEAGEVDWREWTILRGLPC